MQNIQVCNIAQQHSLSADIATGWKPKLRIVGPMPLNFDNHQIDKIIKFLLSSQTSIFTVAYLGCRPQNTFQMHSQLKRNYKYKYSHLLNADYGYLKPFFHKFYRQFEPLIKRPYFGMNPNLRNPTVIFDSSFQSGNLDCAVRIRENEYDLVLRIDSNTNGHILWYYFKVKNNLNQTNRKIKFNIVNMRRNKSCYQRGMKPYVKREGMNWMQQGSNITLEEAIIRFGQESSLFQNSDDLNEQYNLYRKLSFQLTFRAEEQIQIAYCVPYTYSQLLSDIKNLKEITMKSSEINFDIDWSNESLSGLEIPIIRISGAEEAEGDDNKKYAVLIVGRQHPGESNGSHVLKGIIQCIVSDPKMIFLMKNCVFHIVPMLNPDGVVLGNFRTSLFGRDLNRLYKKISTTLIPEVQSLKNYTHSLYKKYKCKLLLFLDIHGHSARRNSFCFGPGMMDANLINEIRLFPKIIASKTEIFRFPSCSFRVDEMKKSTARAVLGKMVGLSYTIQSSNWEYYLHSTGQSFEFTVQGWFEVGQAISKAISEYIQMKIEKKKMINKKGSTKFQAQSPSKRDQIFKNYHLKAKQNLTRLTISPSKLKNVIKQVPKASDKTKTLQSEEQQEQSSIRKSETDRKDINNDVKDETMQLQNQSDKMSQTGQDSDSDEEDISREKFRKYAVKASKMFLEFEKAYYGDDYEKYCRYKNIDFSLGEDSPKKKPVQIMACHKKKISPSQDNKYFAKYRSEKDIKSQKKPKTPIKNVVDNIIEFKKSVKNDGNLRINKQIQKGIEQLQIHPSIELKKAVLSRFELINLNSVQQLQMSREREVEIPERKMNPVILQIPQKISRKTVSKKLISHNILNNRVSLPKIIQNVMSKSKNFQPHHILKTASIIRADQQS